jgi:FKBP-type peptidyl-prolyl cis-trans isomerase
MKRAGKEGDSEPIDVSGDGGITKKILTEGKGEIIPNGVIAIVHYTGRLQNGNVFDSSVKRGTPFRFKIGKSA